MQFECIVDCTKHAPDFNNLSNILENQSCSENRIRKNFR